MDSELLKSAAAVIEDLRAKLELREKSEQLAISLLKQGSISVEDVLETIEKYATMDKEELNILEKAAELNKSANITLTFGHLSDSNDYSTLDPLTKMLLEDL